MPRATNSPATRKRHKKRLKMARGFMGGRHRLFRTATEAVDHAMVMATEHRRTRKRDYRALWITRISAACRQQGVSYGRFIEGLTKAGITLNRKMLSEIAIRDPDGFAALVESVDPKK